MLDELSHGHDAKGRSRVREALEHEFNAPFDAAERREYERDRWGQGQEARESAAAADGLFADATYGE